MSNLDFNGDVVHVQGSGSKPYTLKNVNGILSCDCPAWRVQSAPINLRTCKHLKKIRGADAEAARVVSAAPAPAAVVAPVAPLATHEEAPSVRVAGHVDAAYAADVLGRAAAEGRKLRQDEKAKLQGPGIILAHSWDGETDPTGFLVSEKLDGVRALFRDGKFISRQGNEYKCPPWFLEGLPNEELDGELFFDRKKFSETISIVKSADSGDKWRQISFMVFDAPKHPGKFEDRIAHCREATKNAKFAKVLAQVECKGFDHLKQMLYQVESLGGEGVMLRKPGSAYEIGRSHSLLKVKSFFDCEAEVTGYLAGKGRHKGTVGSLECKLPNGVQFNVGSGMSDALRRNPPKVGSQITIRYQELSKDGVPRFPVFVATRDYE